ncbi:MAG: Spy/CpxP family protein refolding chaperone [Gammaproteobacteria bacterium]|nr:Spy/CpxP family protein refolding chaperone [Gammaproteobacteria bacterium]
MSKRSKILLASVIGLVTLGSFTAFAGEKCGFGKHGFSPEKRAEFILKRVTGKLDLNETQVSKLKAVQAQFIQQHKERHDRRDELLSLLDTPELDQTKALSFVQQRGEMMKQKAPQMIALMADFSNSLSHEQRGELKQMIKKFSGRGFARHFRSE